MPTLKLKQRIIPTLWPQGSRDGFYPDSTDTFEKAENGQKECSC